MTQTPVMAQDSLKANRAPGVRSVLVVLSARAMVFDPEGMKARIHTAYPEAAVYLRHTNGKPFGPKAPGQVDLVIDFTGPWQRQNPFMGLSLRRSARVAVGRNAWFFRKRCYDRCFDESKQPQIDDLYEREHRAHYAVLELAGIAPVTAAPR